MGAPFEGDGAVYIFYGSATGPSEKNMERIGASDLTTPSPISGFGYSISGGK